MSPGFISRLRLLCGQTRIPLGKSGCAGIILEPIHWVSIARSPRTPCAACAENIHTRNRATFFKMWLYSLCGCSPQAGGGGAPGAAGMLWAALAAHPGCCVPGFRQRVEIPVGNQPTRGETAPPISARKRSEAPRIISPGVDHPTPPRLRNAHHAGTTHPMRRMGGSQNNQNPPPSMPPR